MASQRKSWYVGVATYSLTNSAEQHELPATELFDGEDGYERSKEVLGTIQRSKKTAKKARQTDAVLEDSGGVVLW
jgi:hypothetical protein